MWRKLFLALVVLSFTACEAPGLPDAVVTTDGGAPCGTLGAECCGQDGGDSSLWTCDPGLYCKTHRGGSPTLCFATEDGGAL